MRQSKFSVFDILLALVIVAGIGLNVYAYTGGGEGANPAWNLPPPQSAQTAAGFSVYPAQTAQAERLPVDTPQNDVAATEPPAYPPPRNNASPSANPNGNGENPLADMTGKTWYMYYVLHTDRDANEPLYWYYYSLIFEPGKNGFYDVSLTPLDGNEFTGNPKYPGPARMPAAFVEGIARQPSPDDGELILIIPGEPHIMLAFENWEKKDGSWRGMAIEAGEFIIGEYSKSALISEVPLFD